jgi:hypothetical protein
VRNLRIGAIRELAALRSVCRCRVACGARFLNATSYNAREVFGRGRCRAAPNRVRRSLRYSLLLKHLCGVPPRRHGKSQSTILGDAKVRDLGESPTS